MMDLLGWENWKNWTDQFEQKHANSWTQAEILERVRRLERLHWSWSAVGIGFTAVGGAVNMAGCALSSVGGTLSPLLAWQGCLLIIAGFVSLFGTKLASSNALCTYHLLWDMRRREDEAVQRSEIQDL